MSKSPPYDYWTVYSQRVPSYSYMYKKSSIYTSQILDTDQLKNSFAGSESFRGFLERGPWPLSDFRFRFFIVLHYLEKL